MNFLDLSIDRYLIDLSVFLTKLAGLAARLSFRLWVTGSTTDFDLRCSSLGHLHDRLPPTCLLPLFVIRLVVYTFITLITDSVDIYNSLVRFGLV